VKNCIKPLFVVRNSRHHRGIEPTREEVQTAIQEPYTAKAHGQEPRLNPFLDRRKHETLLPFPNASHTSQTVLYATWLSTKDAEPVALISPYSGFLTT
jgi:hypothetical protein